MEINNKLLLAENVDSAGSNYISSYEEIYKDISEHHDLAYNEDNDHCTVCKNNFTNNTLIDERNIIEICSRGLISCGYCVIPDDCFVEIHINDLIITEKDGCCDFCTVIALGDLVKIKRQRLGLIGEKLPKLVRKVESDDYVIIDKNRTDELRAKEIFKSKICQYNLQMKLVEVHFQFDRNKLFFFYTSDNRIDFRKLAKDLAGEFKTRIELRQIGVREEAKRIGGIGVCGRKFCCSSFHGNNKRIPTHLAAEQNLSSNFSKLSGPCGKLKCCLLFEKDYYPHNTTKNKEINTQV